MEKLKALANDHNIQRLRYGAVKATQGVRAGAGTYFVNKAPIIRWASGYKPIWIIGDAIAGLSVGFVVVSQAIVLSATAGVPLKSALMASWLPGVLYSIMGTSRDISVAPTGTTAGFTATVVMGLAAQKVPPALAPAAISFGVGIWSLVFGFFNLGFLFDFISVPIALAFSLASGFIVVTQQIPIILGEVGTTPVFTGLLFDIIKKIKTTRITTFGIAMASIVILGIFQFIGSKWGSKNQFVRLLTQCRYLIVITIFTIISFAVNRNLDFPFWSVLGETKTPISTVLLPQAPVPLFNFQIAKGLFLPSFFLFFSVSLEHAATAKGFGNLGSYTTNASQEMVSVGAINLVNAVFGGLPVGGGDITRTCLNVSAGANSPLAGVFSSMVVFASLFFFGDVIKYLPTPTIAAITLMAIIDKMPSQKMFGDLWKVSFVGFIQFLLAMNFSLVASGEIGMGLAAVFLMFYTLLRLMFSRPKSILSADLEYSAIRDTAAWWANDVSVVNTIPPGTQVVHVETDVFYLNAERLKRHVLDTVYMNTTGLPYLRKSDDRPWNYRLDKHVETARKRGGVYATDDNLPFLRVLILDMSQTSYVDSEAIRICGEIKAAVRKFAGANVELRFVGLNDAVKKRFDRAGWKLGDPYHEDDKYTNGVGDDMVTLIDMQEKVDYAFDTISHAILFQGEFRDPSTTNTLYKDVNVVRVGEAEYEMNVI